MDDRYDELWDKTLKNAKILKDKTILAWHRFDKHFGVSRFTKKMVLALGLKLIAMAAPNAQVSLHAQGALKKSNPTELLAKINQVSKTEDYLLFAEKNKSAILRWEKEFATVLWQNLEQNIKDIQEAEKKGSAARTRELRKKFTYKEYGLNIDPSYFCATGGLGTLLQTGLEEDIPECVMFVECLKNPNSCNEIIKDLNKHYGKQKETNDIPQTLSAIFKKDPYAICMVLSHRTQSRYHFSFAVSNAVIVDTLMTPEDSIKGKTARYNVTAISDIDKYYTKIRKKGYVFNISEKIGSYRLFQKYMENLEKMDKIKFNPDNILKLPKGSSEPVAFSLPKEQEETSSWQAVGRSLPEKPRIPRKSVYQPRHALPRRGSRLS